MRYRLRPAHSRAPRALSPQASAEILLDSRSRIQPDVERIGCQPSAGYRHPLRLSPPGRAAACPNRVIRLNDHFHKILLLGVKHAGMVRDDAPHLMQARRSGQRACLGRKRGTMGRAKWWHLAPAYGPSLFPTRSRSNRPLLPAVRELPRPTDGSATTYHRRTQSIKSVDPDSAPAKAHFGRRCSSTAHLAHEFGEQTLHRIAC